MKTNPLLSILAALSVLAMAYGLDRAEAALRKFRSITFRVTPTLWIEIAINLIFSATILFLAWLTFAKERNTGLALTFLLIGLLVVLMASPLCLHCRALLPAKLLHKFPISPFFYPMSFFARSGSFILALGICGLWRRPR